MALTIDLSADTCRDRPPRGTPDGRLVFQRKLGQGAEGTVYLAVPRLGSSPSEGPAKVPVQKTGLPRYEKVPNKVATERESVPVAVKVITGDNLERYRTTRRLWASVVHPNIVYPRRMHFEEGTDTTSSRCFVEMELCDTDLLDMVMSQGVGLDERAASVLGGHLASALKHLHGKGIAHQDVKLENVFVKDGIAKLGDLGSIVQIVPKETAVVPASSRQDGDSHEHDSSPEEPTAPHPPQSSPIFMGSSMYAPPEAEILRRGTRKSPQQYSASPSVAADAGDQIAAVLPPEQPVKFAGDMWALGLTLFSAIAGYHPWDLACEERSKEFRRFVRKGAASLFPETFSPGLKSLLARLLSLDPSQRPTASEVLDTPWVTSPPATPRPTTTVGGHTTSPSWRASAQTPAQVAQTTPESADAGFDLDQEEQSSSVAAAAGAAAGASAAAPLNASPIPVSKTGTPPLPMGGRGGSKGKAPLGKRPPALTPTPAQPPPWRDTTTIVAEESISPEMNALGGALGWAGMRTGATGADAEAAGGAALPWIACVTPSPLMLPEGAMRTSAGAGARATSRKRGASPSPLTLPERAMKMSAAAAPVSPAARATSRKRGASPSPPTLPERVMKISAAAAAAAPAAPAARATSRKRGASPSPPTLPERVMKMSAAAAAAPAARATSRKRDLLDFSAIPVRQCTRGKTKRPVAGVPWSASGGGGGGGGGGAGAAAEGEEGDEEEGRRTYKKAKKDSPNGDYAKDSRHSGGGPATSLSTRVSFTSGKGGASMW